MILDSNIIIYSVKKEYQFIAQQISLHQCFVTSITQVEVLGYHNFTDSDVEKELIQLIDNFNILPLNESIISQAIQIRKIKKTSLADAIIGATALIHQLPLMTRNIQDFKHIPNLQLLNPFDQIQA